MVVAEEVVVLHPFRLQFLLAEEEVAAVVAVVAEVAAEEVVVAVPQSSRWCWGGLAAQVPELRLYQPYQRERPQ